MNCPINNYFGPQPAPGGAASFPVFLGVVLALGHFQVHDVAMVVHRVTYIAAEEHIAWYLQSELLNEH